MNKETFLKAFAPAKVYPVQVEGGDAPATAHVRVLSGLERAAFLRSLAAGDEADYLSREKLLVFALCDECGARLFADADLDAVAALSAPALSTLGEKAAEINGLNKRGKDEAKNA